MAIELLKTAAELSELFRLRFDAWKTRADLTSHYPNGEFTDQYDPVSHHWGVRNEFRLVAGASMHISVNPEDVPCAKQIQKYLKGYEPPYCMLRRLVVSTEARSNGYASSLDKFRANRVIEQGEGTAMVIISSDFRVQKLKKLGFNQACAIGDFETFPGGKSTLMIASSAELAKVHNTMG